MIKKYLTGSLFLAAVLAFYSCDSGRKASSSYQEELSNAAKNLEELSSTAEGVADKFSPAIEQLESLTESLDDSGSPSSGSGDRKAIEDFFKRYEDFVVKFEKAQKSNDSMALLSLAAQTADLSTKALDFQNNAAWTIEDMAKYKKLAARIAAVSQ